MKKQNVASRLLEPFLGLIALWIVSTILIVLTLRWLDPPTSAFMLRAHVIAWRAHETGFRLQHTWMDEEHISASLKLAVIAAEDQRFAQHHGFDLDSINRAFEDRQRGKRLRGASTISQQVAKNLFLWPGQSWIRKGIESYFTVLIETLWPKRRILEVYLNIAEFGRGVYGAEAAAQRFFRTSAQRLSPAEAALLAAVLPNPIRLKAHAPSAYVRGRQHWILGQMRLLGGRTYLKRLDA